MVNDEDLETLTAEVPTNLKALVDADSRYNREVVEAALWSEFGGHGTTGLERRIQEKQRRIEVIENEIEERKAELKREREKLNAYRDKLDQRSSVQDTVLNDAADIFSLEQVESDNPAIQNWAEKANLPPDDFVKRLKDRLDEQ